MSDILELLEDYPCVLVCCKTALKCQNQGDGLSDEEEAEILKHLGTGLDQLVTPTFFNRERKFRAHLPRDGIDRRSEGICKYVH